MMIFAVPRALWAWPAMKSRATDAAIGSLPLNLGSFPVSLIVPMDRIFSLSPGQYFICDATYVKCR